MWGLSNETHAVCITPKVDTDHSYQNEDIKKQKEKKGCNGHKDGKIHCELKGENSGTKLDHAAKVWADNSDPEEKSRDSKEDKRKYHYEDDVTKKGRSRRMLT